MGPAAGRRQDDPIFIAHFDQRKIPNKMYRENYKMYRENYLKKYDADIHQNFDKISA